MKKIIMAIYILILAACSTNISSEDIKVVTFDTSLKCADCETKMFDTLPKEDGVIDLEVSLEQKLVKIVFNNNETTVEKLAKKINEMGYSAYVKNISSN